MDNDEKWMIVAAMNDSYLDDERHNLDVELNARIVIIADLGLWFGRRSAYKVLDETNLRECLTFSPSCDYAEWFVEDGELQARQIHHDGSNRYTYRAIRDDLTQDQLIHLEDDVLDTEELMDLTRSLAPDVCKVYGLEVDCENISAYN